MVFTNVDGGTRLLDRPRHVFRVTVRGGLFSRSPLAQVQRAFDKVLWPGVVMPLGNPVGTSDGRVVVFDVLPLATAGPRTARDLASRVESVTGLEVSEVADVGIPTISTNGSREAAFDEAEREAADDSLAAQLRRAAGGSAQTLRLALLAAVVLGGAYVLSKASSLSWGDS